MYLPLLPDFARPLLFAHRGLSAEYPENTMAAFRAARDRGIPGIELDIHMSQDGKLVVFHDDTTLRIQGVADPGTPALKIETSTYDCLSRVDIGSWKGREYSSERMPLLDDVFEECGSSQYFDIEIKSRDAMDNGLESLLCACLERWDMRGRCLVSSFNPFSLRRFKRLCPTVPTAIIWTDREELYWFLRRGEGRWIGSVDVLKPEHHLVRSKHQRFGRPILPWTVDSIDESKRLIGAGVVGLISNSPQSLFAL
jgi:glycerophosphoryl diester phosphodiesterase